MKCQWYTLSTSARWGCEQPLTLLSLALPRSLECLQPKRRVSIWRGDNVEVLENELHERSMPSIVSFTGTKRLMGQQAREKIKTNAANT